MLRVQSNYIDYAALNLISNQKKSKLDIFKMLISLISCEIKQDLREICFSV